METRVYVGWLKQQQVWIDCGLGQIVSRKLWFRRDMCTRFSLGDLVTNYPIKKWQISCFNQEILYIRLTCQTNGEQLWGDWEQLQCHFSWTTGLDCKIHFPINSVTCSRLSLNVLTWSPARPGSSRDLNPVALRYEWVPENATPSVAQ